ncbi:glycosyltransferase [Terrimicrobium sacchariphilum]|uniref:Glycosyltransferase n=1 Tax=Terrimicrobium sacchariphilum TaxID=690879 RepID=A0A146GCI0_TERSA|nr:glycosyltransferase family 1 protein [Terrimicrobium sacchariphilum]GAT34893.1 glycosyltransferase [Terrimicrobium sacchariphilum]
MAYWSPEDGVATVHAPAGTINRSGVDNMEARTLPGSTGRFDHLWEQVAFPYIAETDVLWTLMGSGPVLHPGKKHVMVIHDINFLLLPGLFSAAFRSWYWMACAEAGKRADVVVCFTEYVRQSLIDRLHISGDRIRVISQGPGLDGIANADTVMRPAEEQPYFLCVGSMQPHKNLAVMLEAWDRFRERYPYFQLKVVGRKQAGFSHLNVNMNQDLPGVEFTGYVDDAALIALYKGATGFVYPSSEEGFGLPVVEAFYCSCPVVTSNRSCLPEVAGDAALFVEPTDAGAIEAAMIDLVQSGELRQQLKEKGRQRAELYDWSVAGRHMAEILRSV